MRQIFDPPLGLLGLMPLLPGIGQEKAVQFPCPTKGAHWQNVILENGARSEEREARLNLYLRLFPDLSHHQGGAVAVPTPLFSLLNKHVKFLGTMHLDHEDPCDTFFVGL